MIHLVVDGERLVVSELQEQPVPLAQPATFWP